MAMAAVQFRLNGQPRSVDAAPSTPLVHVLRDTLQLRATRIGCGEGECGACKVLVDGRAVASCDTPLHAVQGCDVVTLEGLGSVAAAAGLREAFVAEQAAQCGYCSSGMLIAATALLLRQPRPDAAAVRQALDDHLCRCGAHNRIVRAVVRAGQR